MRLCQNTRVNYKYFFLDYRGTLFIIVLFLASLSCVCELFFQNKEHDDDDDNDDDHHHHHRIHCTCFIISFVGRKFRNCYFKTKLAILSNSYSNTRNHDFRRVHEYWLKYSASTVVTNYSVGAALVPDSRIAQLADPPL